MYECCKDVCTGHEIARHFVKLVRQVNIKNQCTLEKKDGSTFRRLLATKFDQATSMQLAVDLVKSVPQ